MEDFIKSIGIDKEGKMKNDSYVIQADDLLELSKWYNVLTKSRDTEEDETQSRVTQDIVDIHFTSKLYDIMLYGEMDTDNYYLEIKEISEE